MEEINYQNQTVQNEEGVVTRNGYRDGSLYGPSNACASNYDPYRWNKNQSVTQDFNYMPIQQAGANYYPYEPVQANIQSGLEQGNCNNNSGAVLQGNAQNNVQSNSKKKKNKNKGRQRNVQLQQIAAQKLKSKSNSRSATLKRRRKKMYESEKAEATATATVSTVASEANHTMEENFSNVGDVVPDQPKVVEEQQEPMEDFVDESNPEDTPSAGSNLENTNVEKPKEKKIKVGIISSQYPDVELKPEELQAIQAYVAKALMRLPEGSFFPRFQETYLKKGAVVAICADKESKEWIRATIPNAEICPGMEFRVVEVSYLWKYTDALVFIPGPPMDTAAILDILRKQNENLRTDKWLVYDRRNESKKGCELVVGVDGMSLETLSKIDFRPYLGLGRVHFILGKIKGPKRGKSQSEASES